MVASQQNLINLEQSTPTTLVPQVALCVAKSAEPDVVWHDQHWTVGPRMFLQHRLEVRRASRNDDFVSLDLLFFSAGNCNVEKLFISPQVLESGGDILMKVLPLQRIILMHS